MPALHEMALVGTMAVLLAKSINLLGEVLNRSLKNSSK
jgi:hypothetical protein